MAGSALSDKESDEEGGEGGEAGGEGALAAGALAAGAAPSAAAARAASTWQPVAAAKASTCAGVGGSLAPPRRPTLIAPVRVP